MDTQVSTRVSEDTALAVAPETALAADWEGIRNHTGIVAGRIKRMITNGKSLADHEAIALAHYSVTNDLNPFIGECYYLPGTGPTPGVLGFRRKAQEQMEHECRIAGVPFATYQVEFYLPNEDEYEAKPGCIAYKAVIKDTISSEAWRKSLIQMMRELKDAGVKEPYQEALHIVGSEPQWDAIGVVYKEEDFGRVEKFERHERAKKRAEKLALKKRFPRIKLPEYESEDQAPIPADIKIVDEEPRRLPKGERKTEEEMVTELFGKQPSSGRLYTRDDYARDQATNDDTIEGVEVAPNGDPEAIKAKLMRTTLVRKPTTQDRIRAVMACLDYVFMDNNMKWTFLSWLSETKVNSSTGIPDPRLWTALDEYMEPRQEMNSGTIQPTNSVVLEELNQVKVYLTQQKGLFA